MIFRAARFIVLSTLLLAMGSKASEKPALVIQPDTIIRQEITLSDILISIHRLQLDFLDQDARTALQQAQQTLSIGIHTLPGQIRDPEASDLRSSLLSLWPVVSKHITWLSTLPASSEPPVASALLRVLAKMERQLLLLRQKVISVQSEHPRKLRFLEQALLMQHMTRDYLGLLTAEQNTELTIDHQMQLKALANRFDQRMTVFSDELGDHPHAMKPVRQAQAAWSFIHSRFEKFPEQQTPDLIVRYGNRIVSRLSSIHRMF